MWVLNKDKNAIINLDRVENVFISYSGKGVLASSTSAKDSYGNCKKYTLGEYDEERKEEFALRELFDAISDGEQCFEMPSEREAELGTVRY